MPTLYLFADTNLFLQYKPLHEIYWSGLGDFDHIEIVVCPTVQREIDALKDGREGRRSDQSQEGREHFPQHCPTRPPGAQSSLTSCHARIVRNLAAQ